MSFSKEAWFRTPFALLYCPSSHNQTKLTSFISLLWKHWKLLPISPQKPEVWLQFNLNAAKKWYHNGQGAKLVLLEEAQTEDAMLTSLLS